MSHEQAQANEESQPDAQPVSQIVITFAGPGSAEFQFNTQGITPAQLFALQGWLSWYAPTVFEATRAQQQQMAHRIVVPGNGMLRH